MLKSNFNKIVNLTYVYIILIFMYKPLSHIDDML